MRVKIYCLDCGVWNEFEHSNHDKTILPIASHEKCSECQGRYFVWRSTISIESFNGKNFKKGKNKNKDISQKAIW